MKPRTTVFPDGTVQKRCPSCGCGLRVDPLKDSDICKECGVTYYISLAEGVSRKTGNAHGISLYYKPTEKTCSKCGKTQPIENFNKDSDSRDKHAAMCRSCARKANRKYYQINNHWYQYKTSASSHPDFSQEQKLDNVLSYLIRISRQGKNSDKILGDALENIRESIA